MARPKKSTEQKKKEGTYRKDRDQALHGNPNLDMEMLEVVKAKLIEIREAIRETDVKAGIVEIGRYAAAYKKLADILSIYVPTGEKKEPSPIDAVWKP
jgi:predicted metal-dependent phosphotriesterase family hydrolase